jgi:hypothetical protein
MKNLQRSLILGIAAGTVDVVPMILQGLNWYANASAFVFWIGMGVIIPSIDWKLRGWLKGLIVAELAILPILIIVAKADIKGIVPISLMTALLGSLVGHCSGRP